jgi:radical SAM superfamily enzyme YgiQ (UPF0313 family)
MNKPRRVDCLLVVPAGQVYQRVYTMLEAGQATAVLRESGAMVEMLDLEKTGYNPGIVRERIASVNPRCILYVNQWPEDIFGPLLPPVIEAAGAQSVICGRAAAIFAREILEHHPGIDHVVVGESEGVLPRLARAVADGGDLVDLPGIMSRTADGGLRCVPPETIVDPEAIPLADRLYLENGRGTRIAPLLMNRDCRGVCTFCIGRAFRRAAGCSGDRYRSPAHVCDEIAMIVERYGTRYFSFCDDNFFGMGGEGIERARSLAELLIERGIKIWFYIDARVDDVEASLFARLREAGLRKVNLGIESGSQAVLDRFRKGVRVEDNARALSVLRDLKISARPGFIMFEPRMSLGELAENFDFLERMNLASTFPVAKLGDEVMIPPGSELEEELRREGLEAYRPAEAGDRSTYRIGILTSFRYRDEKVRMIRDAAQDVAAKLLRRRQIGSKIAAALKQHPDAATGVDQERYMKGFAAWNDGLPRFAFDVVKSALVAIRDCEEVSDGTYEAITAGIGDRLDRYDITAVGHSLAPPSPSARRAEVQHHAND